MRRTFLLALIAACLIPRLHALATPELTPEEKAQAAYAKGMSNPDKSARVNAITAFESAKPTTPRSWQMLAQTMNADPDIEVRYTAYMTLARMPARDTSIARLLVNAFDALKLNDIKTRVFYAKGMAACEFKHDTAAALADQLSKMRYAEDAKGMYGRRVTDEARDELKQKRDELKEMLDAFNDLAHSDVSAADKEMPAKVKKWWTTNHEKIQRADAEILAKYAKEDAEAEAAAKAKKKASEKK